MSLHNEVGLLFREDPEKALALVRENLGGRQRRIVPLLDGLLEETDGLRLRDPGRALSVGEAALSLTLMGTSRPWLVARAFGVLASVCAVRGQTREALRLLGRGLDVGADTFEAGSLLARKAAVLCRVFRWREALSAAGESVAKFERLEVPRETDFCSLPFSLMVRARVFLDAYAAGLDVELLGVLRDCERCLDVIGQRKSLARTVLFAIHNRGRVIATLGLMGNRVSGDDLERTLDETRSLQARLIEMGYPRRSLHRGLILWLEGQLEAQLADKLTPRAERFFRGGRDILVKAGSVSDAVSLTLDYQWWLVKSGRGLRAVGECDFLEEHAAELGPLEGVVLQWVSAFRERRIGAEFMMVFRDVRRVRDVMLPRPVKRRLPSGW